MRFVLGAVGLEPRPVVVALEGAQKGQGRRREDHYRTRWLTAMMFPSLSLNHAVLAPPAVAMLFLIFMPGMSSSSKTTPRALSSATSASTSSTCQNAWLAFDVPALRV